MYNVVLGPPGTGKTTYLLNKVEEYFEKGTPPEKLGYLAFTQKSCKRSSSQSYG